MIRMDVKPDIYDPYYRNESPLPSNAMSVIASYIDERGLKEISMLCPGIHFSLILSLCQRLLTSGWPSTQILGDG